MNLRLNGGDQKLNWTAGAYGLHIDGNYYDGWEGPAFFGAQEFNYAGNSNGYFHLDPKGNGVYTGYTAYDYTPGPWPYSQSPYPEGCGCPGYASQGTLAVAGPDGGLPATKAPYSLTTNSYAIFGQVEYRLNDLIGLTLGARYTNDRKDYNFSWYPYEYYPQSTNNKVTILHRPQAVALNQDFAQDRSDNMWAGKAQVDFHLAPSQLLYVSYNRGVKGGGFTAPLFPAQIANPSDLSFKPEELTSYELGLKSEFLDHTLRVNSAVYYYDYHDYQALIYTVSLNQLVKNADATHKGVETEIDWAAGQSVAIRPGCRLPGCRRQERAGAVLRVRCRWHALLHSGRLHSGQCAQVDRQRADPLHTGPGRQRTSRSRPTAITCPNSGSTWATRRRSSRMPTAS